MGTIDEVLKKCVNMHACPTEEQILSDLARLQGLISEFERPEFAEYIRFAVAWQKLEQELRALQHKIHERMAVKPISPVNDFLKKLIKKN